MEHTATKHYRADIDGLRAIAVVSVLIFHSGIAYLPGGFVGVDIFFVISGFLISRIIISEGQAGVFTFSSFYERRIRRIFPALLLVLSVTLVFFWIIGLPSQADNTAQAAITAVLSVSNIFFWTQSGYFSPNAELQPLLHTWSLGVEEQFYIFFPIIVLCLVRFKINLRWAMPAVTFAAFVVGLWMSYRMPSAAYYLLPARAWELGIGAVLAVGIIPAVRKRGLAEAISTAGLFAIIASFFLIRSGMAFPGWIALLPCLGTAAILHTGHQSWVGQHLLGSRPFVAVGLISYSLYLWHWPVIVGMRVYLIEPHLNFYLALMALAISAVLAWLTWAFVERPFRNRKRIGARGLAKWVGGGSAALVSVCLVTIAIDGLPHRATPDVRLAAAGAQDMDPLQDTCRRSLNAKNCTYPASTSGPIRLVVIGDSHASALRPAFDKSSLLAGGAGTLMWSESCPFILGSDLANSEYANLCSRYKPSVLEELKQMPKLETVVLAGRWAVQYFGTRREISGAAPDYLIDDLTPNPSGPGGQQVFMRGMKRTIAELRKLGVNVIIIGPLPEPHFDVPPYLALAKWRGTEPLRLSREDVRVRMEAMDQVLGALVSGQPNVHYVSLWKTICQTDCPLEVGGAALYWDSNHPTKTGAKTIIAAAIEKEVVNIRTKLN